MYRKANRAQLSIEEFFLPFGGRLSATNRWVKMAKLMPWEMIEDLYAESFKDVRDDGRPPIPARIAYGAIYIKEQENLTDIRTVEYITENPYAQYFLGLSSFFMEPLFDASMLTHFRKRFTPEMINKINEEIYKRSNPPKPPDDGKNDGSLILDASVAPSDIRYPTDLSLLNDSRENTEAIIDSIWEATGRSGRRTFYSRKKARVRYLEIAKQRRPRKHQIQKAIRHQLSCVRKNIELLDSLPLSALSSISPWHLERLSTIRKVLYQQSTMLMNKTRSVEGRIVSLRQPHVRPMVRGKARNPVEFGQKLSVSVVRGFTFVERQSWDNFNEGKTLIDSAEKYKSMHSVYPSAILADKAYRTRENLNFCKQHGIRLSGPRLGRPKLDEAASDRAQTYRDSCERNVVEGRYGIGKRRYGLGLIMSVLPNTAETEAALNVLVMNVAHLLRAFLRLLSRWLIKLPFFCFFVRKPAWA